MRALIGLDIGTSGVKALAVSEEDGAILARCEVGYPLSTPRPGWAEQDPGRLVARDRSRRSTALAVDEVAGIGLSGQMHGLVALDAAGEVIRPAILWNDGRTAAECAEIEERVGPRAADRAHRQPRADRLHRAEAAVAAQARARGLRADRADHAPQGLRPRCSCAASTRSTWPTRRARCCSTSRGGAGPTRCSTRSSSTRRGCRGCSSRPRCRARRRTACRSPRAPATRRRARSASASTGRGRSRSRSGPPASSSPRCRPSPPTRRRACTRSATPCRAAGTRWA